MKFIVAMKIDMTKAVHFLWAWTKLYSRMYRKNLWHFENKARLAKACTLVTVYAICCLVSAVIIWNQRREGGRDPVEWQWVLFTL